MRKFDFTRLIGNWRRYKTNCKPYETIIHGRATPFSLTVPLTDNTKRPPPIIPIIHVTPNDNVSSLCVESRFKIQSHRIRKNSHDKLGTNNLNKLGAISKRARDASRRGWSAYVIGRGGRFLYFRSFLREKSKGSPDPELFIQIYYHLYLYA